MENRQSLTNYKPSAIEEKLLEVLLNPKYRMKSITDICQIAEMSRQSYYNAFAKPEFEAYYKQKSLEMVKQSIAPVLAAFMAEAKRGSFQHGKVLLEMGGLYAENQNINLQGKLDFDGLSAEERKERIKELMKQLQETPEP